MIKFRTIPESGAATLNMSQAEGQFSRLIGAGRGSHPAFVESTFLHIVHK